MTLNKRLVLALVAGVTLAACSSTHNDDAGDADGDYAYRPVVDLLVESPVVTEGNEGTSSIPFLLTLSHASQTTINVSFVTTDGTASAGLDYQYRKGVVSFLPGQTQKTVNIEVLGDQLDEIDETFYVRLTSLSDVRIMTPEATGSIQDDDDPVSISIGDASVMEGNAGIRKLLFPVTLTTPSGKEISVDYITSDGAAIAPADYFQADGQITLAPGAVSGILTVRVVGDTADEGDEHFVLDIHNPVNAEILDASGLGTIMNDDPVSGLQQRPVNLECIAPDQPTVNTSIETTQVFAGVAAFTKPVAMVQAPNEPSQWFVVEQDGYVYRFDNDASVSNKGVFVDVSGPVNSVASEAGLLGIAFHPNYASNRHVYLSYTATGPDGAFPLTSRVSRFESLDNGLTLDPGTEVVLLSQDQRYTNHNGGHIAFGPDGYLYLGLGDAGDAGDPENRAQNTKNLFGSMVRIDADAGSPYGIPADNPFSGNPLCDISTTGIDSSVPCPEIFAWGLRNPWRWSFDTGSGELWLADVGQYKYEEVDIIEVGGNYGWRIQEGFACYNPSSGCDKSGLVQPIIEYNRSVGQSITGGFVYRGTEIPQLYGRYVFADFNTGTLFATTTQGGGSFDYEVLADTSYFISSFAQDTAGEIYFLDYASGAIHKIAQFGGTSNETIPASLSDTGCVSDIDATLPATPLIPYDVNRSFWSDGATKERSFAIPEGTSVDVNINGDWLFPVGTVLVKNFRLSGTLVETRHLMRHSNGEWAGYTYEWNDEQTEANRVIGGKSKVVNGQTWVFPSETQCMACHTSVAGFTLGLEHAQLNKDLLYPSTGITANQLFTADAIDVLTDPLADAPENMPSLVTGVAAGGLTLDFNWVPTTTYPGQDAASNVAVLNDGATLELLDNTWYRTVQTFVVTVDTVLEFDFDSTVQGEIHGIGFDENTDSEDANRIFQLWGTQNWNRSINDYRDYTGSGVTHYVIPVGQYYVGDAMNLVFVNDHDGSSGHDSRFTNVKVTEAASPAGPSSEQDRVRSYLHVNCSGCHRPLGPTSSSMDLRFDTTWPSMNACDVVPTLGSLGIGDARIIAPGDSSRSVLVNRMSRRDAYAMPPIGSHVVDAEGVALLTNWVDGLTICP